MKFFEQMKRLERVDQLIRMKATGSPKDLAQRLSLSERSIYDLINQMKSLGAPIIYNSLRGSYEYEESGQFRCQLTFEKGMHQRISGGISEFFFGLQENCSERSHLVGTAVGASRKPCR